MLLSIFPTVAYQFTINRLGCLGFKIFQLVVAYKPMLIKHKKCMGSTEPIKFSRRGHKPITGIKSMIFCNLWLQNDGFNCKLLNSMGSKWIRGFWYPCFSSRGFHFPRISLSPNNPQEAGIPCIIKEKNTCDWFFPYTYRSK